METLLDLNNPQHIAIRKLAADIYCRYVNALVNGDLEITRSYFSMALCLRRFVTLVLNDSALVCFCVELEWALDVQRICLLNVLNEVAA